ncbi:cell division protein ZapA [Paenibacillus macquariensis]|uniref:cell division protein ZapA n=1 Tax=Paenibacillus macquariensis TaxID=948756 RepID=UPI0007C22ED5|nr:cell division protein ZapA [Paenibacillus macquariensis]MEC0092932.1 cell division protein ZapA [Paenibacillus macquariensis]OAB36297.1 hypothetical protein PMSM_07575 [Paenibacillus macquariensis subsp. macquariensis]
MNIPDRNRVTVEIYGTSYKLVGSSSDYMKKIAQYVDERMNAVSKNHTRLDTPKIAVLAAVHMAEEAIQTQEVRNELKMLTGERSELKAEILKLIDNRTEQTEKLLKQQEESAVVVKEKEELQAELHRVQAELQQQLENNQSLLDKEIVKNKQVTQNQADQEQKHKQSVLELDKQLVDLRNSNNQGQMKLRGIEKELKTAQEAHTQLNEQYKQSVQREQTAKAELQSLHTQVTKLQNESNQIKDSLAKSETARQLLQKSLEESDATARKLEGEVNKLLAETKSWKMLADKRMEEISDLERTILEGTEQNETLESGMKSLHDELSVLKEQAELEVNIRQSLESDLLNIQQQYEEVQVVYRETVRRDEDARIENLLLLEEKEENERLLKELQDKIIEISSRESENQVLLEATHDELSVLKEQAELEMNIRQSLESDLLNIQQQYEEVQVVYRETVRRDEDARVENLLLLEEKEENERLLNELQDKLVEVASRESENQVLLETLEHSLKEWTERYNELESKQSSWGIEEQKLQAELDIWQQEIAVTEQQREELRGEKETVSRELLEIGESFELVAHQYRLLQVEHDMQLEQTKELKEEHRKLSEEYGKLQSEYNEWIELIEQDKG